MTDPNITMEEYIRIEEEKAQSRGMTFNWQTATFGRMKHYYEEECFTNFEEEFPSIVFEKINGNSFDTKQRGIMGEYDDERGNFETEFPAIVFDNTFTSDTTPPCEPTIWHHYQPLIKETHGSDTRLCGIDPRDETGSGSKDEDGIFWRGASGVCQMSDTVMDLDTADTLCFQLGGARKRMTWRQFILALGLHTEQEMA
ncbi:hypothetical protein Tco_1009613 [Tanacetum coccineum]